jgi:hypothetical protein
MDEQVDVASFLKPAVLPEGKTKVVKIGPVRGKFIPPVPEKWVIAANKIAVKRHSPAVLFVGLVLWQRLMMRKRQPLRVTRTVWSEFGLSRPVVRRSLKALEDGGLITVERFKHRSPAITICD